MGAANGIMVFVGAIVGILLLLWVIYWFMVPFHIKDIRNSLKSIETELKNRNKTI